jgi:hypothetical protein
MVRNAGLSTAIERDLQALGALAKEVPSRGGEETTVR